MFCWTDISQNEKFIIELIANILSASKINVSTKKDNFCLKIRAIFSNPLHAIKNMTVEQFLIFVPALTFRKASIVPYHDFNIKIENLNREMLLL